MACLTLVAPWLHVRQVEPLIALARHNGSAWWQLTAAKLQRLPPSFARLLRRLEQQLHAQGYFVREGHTGGMSAQVQRVRRVSQPGHGHTIPGSALSLAVRLTTGCCHAWSPLAAPRCLKASCNGTPAHALCARRVSTPATLRHCGCGRDRTSTPLCTRLKRPWRLRVVCGAYSTLNAIRLPCMARSYSFDIGEHGYAAASAKILASW